MDPPLDLPHTHTPPHCVAVSLILIPVRELVLVVVVMIVLFLCWFFFFSFFSFFSFFYSLFVVFLWVTGWRIFLQDLCMHMCILFCFCLINLFNDVLNTFFINGCISFVNLKTVERDVAP